MNTLEISNIQKQGFKSKNKAEKYSYLNDKNISSEEIKKLLLIIKKELNNFPNKNSLVNIKNYLSYLKEVLAKSSIIDKNYLTHQLLKIYQLIDQIILENKNIFINNEYFLVQLQSIQEEILNLSENTTSKQFKFINFLIEDLRNLEYIELTLSKLPNIVNTRDSNDEPLIVNLIKRYFLSIEEDKNNKFYYENIISLIISQKSFKLNFKEKENLVKIIYNFLYKISITKKEIKKHQQEINFLKNLINSIKNTEKQKFDLKALATKYKIEIDFKDYLMSKIPFATIPDSADTERVYVDDYLISIDKKSTLEIDDALSCKKLENGNYLLGVHIASVLGYFNYNDSIINEALNRAKTIYLKKGHNKEIDSSIIPIFSYKFSTEIASLRPNEPKYARSYYFEIDNEGNIINEKFIKTIIKSKRMLDFNETNKILEKGCDDDRLLEVITNLKTVTEFLENKFKPTKIYEKVKDQLDDFSDLRIKRKGAEKIVYYATLLTGNKVAEYFANNKYPFLYRVHGLSEENYLKLQMFLKDIYHDTKYKKLEELVETIIPKGLYAMSGNHQGLNLDHYCHCTSCIRRAPDIIVEHALDICYHKQPSDKELFLLEEEISKRITLLNSKMTSIDCFKNEYKRTYQKKRK